MHTYNNFHLPRCTIPPEILVSPAHIHRHTRTHRHHQFGQICNIARQSLSLSLSTETLHVPHERVRQWHYWFGALSSLIGLLFPRNTNEQRLTCESCIIHTNSTNTHTHTHIHTYTHVWGINWKLVRSRERLSMTSMTMATKSRGNCRCKRAPA